MSKKTVPHTHTYGGMLGLAAECIRRCERKQVNAWVRARQNNRQILNLTQK